MQAEVLESATLDNFEVRPGMEKSLRIIRRYTEGLPRPNPLGLFIFGEKGSGKSHLAGGVAQLARAAGMTVAWLHVPSWANLAREDRAAERDRMMAEAIQADLLVLDSLADSLAFAQEITQLAHLVDERHRNNAPIVITNRSDVQGVWGNLGNLTRQQNVACAQMLSRLCEMCKLTRIRSATR